VYKADVEEVPQPEAATVNGVAPVIETEVVASVEKQFIKDVDDQLTIEVTGMSEEEIAELEAEV
jgi:hypothetical protein